MIFEDEDQLGYYVQVGLPFPGIDLTAQDLKDIEAAGIHAHEGRDRLAERCRRLAGYGNL